MSEATDRRDLIVGRCQDLDVALDEIETVYDELVARRRQARVRHAALVVSVAALPASAFKTKAQAFLSRVDTRLKAQPPGANL